MGYVIGRIGSQWYLWGFSGASDMKSAGYSDVHVAERIDGIPIKPARNL